MIEAGCAMQAIAAMRNGRPRKHKARTLWDAIQFIASTGCQWAQPAQGLPARHDVAVSFLTDARQRSARYHQRGAGGMGAG
ncbi:MAG: hypothetical protein EOO38_15760, partial [Cytophagaceae bacterium]